MAVKIDIEDWYPYSYTPRSNRQNVYPRFQKIAQLLNSGTARFHSTLKQLAEVCQPLVKLENDPNPQFPNLPYWNNGFFSTFDALTLYGLIAITKPSIYCEIGAGHSTRFANAAKTATSNATHIICIDPMPRIDNAGIQCESITLTVQDCPLDTFKRLKKGDILFLDGSHRALKNSDVTVLFTEIIPCLAPGVIVHIHDIYLPFDYPELWNDRMYSEQYMLAVYLMFSNCESNIILPNALMSMTNDIPSLMHPILDKPRVAGVECHGTSFWFRT